MKWVTLNSASRSKHLSACKRGNQENKPQLRRHFVAATVRDVSIDSNREHVRPITGYTTLLRRWINVNDVDSTSQQRRVSSERSLVDSQVVLSKHVFIVWARACELRFVLALSWSGDGWFYEFTIGQLNSEYNYLSLFVCWWLSQVVLL